MHTGLISQPTNMGNPVASPHTHKQKLTSELGQN